MAGAYGAGRRHCASAGSACLTRRPAAALRSPEPSFALVLGEEGPAPPWITQGRFRGRTAFIALLVTNFVNSARRAPAKPAAPRRAPAKPAAPRRAPAKPAAPRRAPAKPAAPRRAPAKPAAPRRAPAKPAAPRRAPAKPAAPRRAPAKPAAPRRAPAKPAAPRRAPAKPAAPRRAPAKPAAPRRAPAKPAAPRRAPPPSQSALIHKHRRWREKRQDILVTFIDTVEERAKSAAERVAKSAPNFDVDVRGVPEPCPNLPHGHPPVDGIEHMNPVIMTLALSCSMAQVVKLLDHGMPFGMSVVPIPSDRCNVW